MSELLYECTDLEEKKKHLGEIKNKVKKQAQTEKYIKGKLSTCHMFPFHPGRKKKKDRSNMRQIGMDCGKLCSPLQTCVIMIVQNRLYVPSAE